MPEFTARVQWQRQADEPFTDHRYSRRHAWRFDGGTTVPASSSPHAVPQPFSDPQAVDPEEALVAALSSCHMLWFLSLAAKAGWVVEQYSDDAVGLMGRNEDHKVAMTRVLLRPHVLFSGNAPAPSVHEALHHAAHEACYIAQSVRCEVRCEPSASAQEPRPRP